MKISVILCTYNRCQSLATALESIAQSQIADAHLWEVVVVDNNSKDKTRDVVEEFVQRYSGRFRYVFERQQGKSNALNRGIRESLGDVLAFMDDDVVVDTVWLQTLTAVLQKPEWCGAGGRILPERNFTRPAWLSLEGKYALAPLAIFDLGTQAGEMHEPPFGTNMAFRREVFEKIGGFRTDLGPCPGSEIRGEDTEFGCRALAAGRRLWYEPSAIVYHSISDQRLQKKYFLAWWYDKARSDIRQTGIPDDLRQNVAGVPIALILRFCWRCLKWMCAIDSAKRFSCRLAIWGVVAMIQECWRLHTSASRGSSVEVPSVTQTHRIPLE
jgi:glycosyltransferase involved in cell wall biosynthesis